MLKTVYPTLEVVSFLVHVQIKLWAEASEAQVGDIVQDLQAQITHHNYLKSVSR